MTTIQKGICIVAMFIVFALFAYLQRRKDEVEDNFINIQMENDRLRKAKEESEKKLRTLIRSYVLQNALCEKWYGEIASKWAIALAVYPEIESMVDDFSSWSFDEKIKCFIRMEPNRFAIGELEKVLEDQDIKYYVEDGGPTIDEISQVETSLYLSDQIYMEALAAEIDSILSKADTDEEIEAVGILIDRMPNDVKMLLS